MDASPLCAAIAVLALVPGLLTLWNLALFRPPPATSAATGPVSLIVPARDEAANIVACLHAALLAAGPGDEIVVVDDGSTDGTSALIAQVAAADARVRRIVPPGLPDGWSGKVHACLRGAEATRHDILVFIDADVRLAPGSLARLAAGLRRDRAGLTSGFPRERAETLGEILLVPLIHVLLLGYLPLWLSRRRGEAALGAGCGQLMVADRGAYFRIGGHGAVRRTWHDGVTLPRAFRAAGEVTTLFDATSVATCRMYEGFGASWRGFSKNATEGLAKPGALPVWTVLLLGGHVLAPALAIAILCGANIPRAGLLLAAVAVLIAARIAVAVRFRQPALAVVLWPVGVAVTVALQWRALLRPSGRAAVWRGRVQTAP